MAGAKFDYVKAEETINNISSLKSRLNSTLSSANDLIKSNVNNEEVWDSDTSSRFMNDWTKYADESFPSYLKTFEAQITKIQTAINTYEQAER